MRFRNRNNSKTPAWALAKIQATKKKQLKRLYLRSGNRSEKLTEIPIEVFELTDLEVLGLKGNPISEIPNAIAQLQNLSELYLSNNQIIKISDAIARLTNLSKLDLSNNQISEIPDTIAGLQKISQLNLYNNRISRIPIAVAQLENLTQLNLSNNQLGEISEAVTKLRKLSRLYLSNNQISEIPETITRLKNLSGLYLSDNQISEIPEWVTKLESLAALGLSNNQISEIPESITKLENLAALGLADNQISRVPETITQLKNLVTLNLSNNPLIEPPPEIARRGIEIIRQYYRQLRESETDTLYEAKLLIIGEAGAGKTSLAKKIQNPDYQLVSTEQSTEGINILQFQFPLENGQTFRVNIWDFGGQEIYHATHQFFLTKRSLYTLVDDAREEKTDFYHWLNIVELLSDASPLLIIQNQKQDRKRDINQTLRAQFPHLKDTLATNLATNRGLPTLIDTLKHYLKHLPHIGSTLPKTWVNVRNALDRDPRNTISLDEYLQICEQHGFTRRDDALQLSGYLHDLGVCLHFQDNETSRLYDTLILKPSWGTAAVYKVLDTPTVRNNFGRFTWDDLTHIWADEQYASKRGELLELMKKFELCYEIPSQPRHYIAPQLLSDNQLDYPWTDHQNLILRYIYEFMPKGILTRFIVALHSLIHDQRYVWKSGVLLNQDNTQAEVIEYYGKREIKIRIQGSHKRELMAIVTHELDKIHDSYNKRLKYQKLIPCNCPTCNGTQTPYFYDLKKLRERIAHRKDTIECGNPPYTDVNVIGLLNDVMDREHVFSSDRFDDLPSRPHPKPRPTPEVFLSYAWGGDSEAIANQLDAALQQNGITIIRDKRDLGFKGRIKSFMQRLGQGNAIIVILSQKYLISENCMFELVQIAAHGNFYDRIFPIVLDDAKIYKPLDRIQYIKHWETEIEKLNDAMKTVNAANLQGFREDIDLYTQIRATIADLTNTLKDMNTLTSEIHTESDFEQLFQAVEAKLSE
jgi:internalin A